MTCVVPAGRRVAAGGGPSRPLIKADAGVQGFGRVKAFGHTHAAMIGQFKSLRLALSCAFTAFPLNGPPLLAFFSRDFSGAGLVSLFSPYRVGFLPRPTPGQLISRVNE